MIVRLIASAVAAAGIASSASALSVSYSSGIFAGRVADYPQVNYLPQFDPALGTLTGVAADLYGSVTGYGYVEVLYNNRSPRYAGN